MLMEELFMKTIIVFAAMMLFCFSALSAQNLVEIRVSPDSEYRFVGWNYMAKRDAAIDLFYIGVPGANEFNFGGGYLWKPRPNLTITPAVYYLFAKEDALHGGKIAVILSYEQSSFKLTGFIAHAFGQFPKYQVMDALDFTRMLGKRFEAGVSSGFFHQNGAWNLQIGPIIKLNDGRGSWAVSYRFGPQKELRFGRVVTF